MKVVKVNPNFPEPHVIEEGARLLKEGGLVAFPTETVYGVGANLLDKKAIDRLYKIKKRPKGKPFTIHIARFEALKELKVNLSERAEKIVRKFWPGPLTVLVLNKKKEKIGIRMPNNKVALALIDKASLPIVAPSANLSGKNPPTSAKEIILDVDMVLDGGNTAIGIESTVLDVTVNPFKILRKGALSGEDLLADYHVLFVCTGNSCRSVMAKGMLEKFLKEAGLSKKVRVDSAGTGGFAGIPAATNTIEVMKEEGVDVSAHRGKPISPALLKKSDFVFVMEDVHKRYIVNALPKTALKTRLLKEASGIPDPIGKSIEEYRRIRDIIKDSVENIFLELFKKENKG
ncbi:MAG: L-threonylcarbamoyladenylate synthase [Candidatus Gorgyraea atricola]|nr:L-threonylcarbamoyladenylate synthase [Candidatus Gorgyraea atricola]